MNIFHGISHTMAHTSILITPSSGSRYVTDTGWAFCATDDGRLPPSELRRLFGDFGDLDDAFDIDLTALSVGARSKWPLKIEEKYQKERTSQFKVVQVFSESSKRQIRETLTSSMRQRFTAQQRSLDTMAEVGNCGANDGLK